MDSWGMMGLVATLLALGSAAGAQRLDPAQGADPVEVTDDGRLIVESGGARFDCALAAADGAVTLDECRPVAAPPQALATADWQGRIRDMMGRSGCKLSTLGAVGDVIEAEAAAAGIPADEIAAARAEIAARVDAEIDRMLRAGELTVRDGEYALDACG